MSIDQIFVVGNSWSIPSLEAPNPAFLQLGLNNRWEQVGITLDAQAEYIIDNDLTSKFKVIWLIGHHHRADPRGDGSYLLPYEWGDGDIWGKLVQDLSKPDGTPRKYACSERIKQAGWKPSIDLKEGLQETYQWYLENVAEKSE